MNKCRICNTDCPSTFCGDCSKMIGQGIAALTTDRDKWRDRCERLIGHYGAWQIWMKSGTHGNRVDLYVGVSDSHGFDFAQQIQREIDDDAK